LKIMHVITGLSVGGAESLLCEMLLNSDQDSDVTVVSLSDIGSFGEKMQSHGIRVLALGMKPGRPSLPLLWKLIKLMKREAPDLVQTWMYHADLLGGLAARIAGNFPVIWGIHHADPRQNKRATIVVARLCSLGSGWIPSHVIACSDAARRTHVSFGYKDSVISVIHNGIRTSRFRNDRVSRLRESLWAGAQVVGHVCRWHPVKDHKTFIEAAGLVHAVNPRIKFALAGPGIETGNSQLMAWIEAAGLAESTFLLGAQSDVTDLMNGIDLHVSSSLHESFSLVTAEAMACGTPCVSTDTGIAATLIGDTGTVVPVQNPQALADGMLDLLALPSQQLAALGAEARERVRQAYSLEDMISKYQDIYRGLTASPHAKRKLTLP